MKPLVRNTIYIAVLAAITVLVFFCYRLNEEKRHLITSNGNINIEFMDEHKFLTEEDIKNFIQEEYGVLTGQRVDSVNLKKVETILDGKSAILKSEAYMTLESNKLKDGAKEGVLNVKIQQRKPLIRFQKESTGVYADETGYIFPIQGSYSSPLTIVDGYIPENGSEWAKKITSMIKWMNKNQIWAENIVQIHADGNGELTLVPREGKEKFLFGQPDNIESKFARLQDYYQYIVPSKEPGYYSTVNVTFDGQIVCKK